MWRGARFRVAERKDGWLRLPRGGWVLEDGARLDLGPLVAPVAAETPPRGAVDVNVALQRSLYELFDSPPSRAPTDAACDVSDAGVARGIALVRRALALAGLSEDFSKRPTANAPRAIVVLEPRESWRFEDVVARHEPALLRKAAENWPPAPRPRRSYRAAAWSRDHAATPPRRKTRRGRGSRGLV